jgi:lipopolysaccharide export LptBFGC system permease protein LptF
MDIMESLGNQKSLSELDLTLEELEKLDNLSINFDLKNRDISVSSTAKDQKGDVLYEYSVNTVSGDVKETKRNYLDSNVVTFEKHIDPLSLSHSTAVVSPTAPITSEVLTEEDLETQKKIQNWDELDMQRDIAFKVMYFFIVFIIGTFGLLFAYFQMSQKQEEEEAAQRGQ